VRCTSRSLFFFQAEDGIRDSSVTGVQTCALPISRISAPLQKKLVAEMRGRIKEDDSSVPAPDGPFAYLRKFREGGQHEMFGRTRSEERRVGKEGVSRRAREQERKAASRRDAAQAR